MIEQVHQHITSELQQNTRTDTIFILAAILLNLLTLAINSAIAGGDSGTTQTIVMFTFVFLTTIVNVVVIFGLLKGKQTRIKLLNGLLKMYKDQGVEGYYDLSILGNYNVRYNLFILVVAALGIVSIVIPLVIK